jgi:hypothetical protein
MVGSDGEVELEVALKQCDISSATFMPLGVNQKMPPFWESLVLGGVPLHLYEHLR